MNQFFEDYNDSYFESNSNSSILPFNNKDYFINNLNIKEKSINENNKTNVKIFPWTLDFVLLII